MIGAADTIIVIDTAGKAEDYDGACSRLFEGEPGEVNERNLEMLMPFPYHVGRSGCPANYRRTGEGRSVGISDGARLRPIRRAVPDAIMIARPNGTGIGLSICRSIVNACDRGLWAGLNQDPEVTVGSLPKVALAEVDDGDA